MSGRVGPHQLRHKRNPVVDLFSPHDYAKQRLNTATGKRRRYFLERVPDHEQPWWVWAFAWTEVAVAIAVVCYAIWRYSQ